MKISMGKYPSWVGPYQVALLLKHIGVSSYDCHKFGEKLSKSFVGNLLQSFHDKFKQRKVKIHIDDWDVWNLDSTLAQIMHPLFVQLKATKQGSGFVDDEDVPENLRTTSANQLTQEEIDQGCTDHNFHARYIWMLDEVIWALGQSVKDSEPEYQLGKDSPFWQHQTRLTNGFRLMGKYWQSFWT